MRAADRLLRGSGRVEFRPLMVLALSGGVIYGAALGSFGGFRPQVVFASLKVPLLMMTSTAVCLPTLFVLHVLLGIGEDFVAALRGILASQATMAVALASMAPLTLVFYASMANYRIAVLGNGVPFLLASIAGQVTLARHYRPLIARDDRHVLTRNAWLFLYMFIAIQSAWVLRPFVGSPDLPSAFFRENAWNNAYVKLWDSLRAAFRS